jgi:hypothetical protein
VNEHSPVGPSPASSSDILAASHAVAVSAALSCDAQAANLASAAARVSSPAERCFTDGVLLVASFLSLREWRPSTLTCKRWYAAAKKERTRTLEFKFMLSSVATFVNLCASPLRHHVSTLSSDSENFVNSACLALRHQLPSLRSLDVSLDMRCIEQCYSSSKSCLRLPAQ